MFQFNFSLNDEDVDTDIQMDGSPPSHPHPDPSPAQRDAEDPAQESSKEVPLQELIRALPTELSYTVLSYSGTLLPRRDFHDARLSILASLFSDGDGDAEGQEGSGCSSGKGGSGVESRAEEVFDPASDVRAGVYEGGMKTWEGAADLVGVLAREQEQEGLQWKNVVELGCGTALPTLFLLARLFEQEGTGKWDGQTRHVCLQDYNRPVLELMTFPNILLTWFLHSPRAKPYRFPHPPTTSPQEPLSLALEPSLLSAFLDSLSALRLRLSFYSGSWASFDPRAASADSPPAGEGEGEGQRRGEAAFDLALTSETIYRPTSLPSLVRSIRQCISPSGRCLVAAKDIYFGVGGSMRDFELLLEGEGMSGRRVWSSGRGSGRGVLEVRVV